MLCLTHHHYLDKGERKPGIKIVKHTPKSLIITSYKPQVNTIWHNNIKFCVQNLLIFTRQSDNFIRHSPVTIRKGASATRLAGPILVGPLDISDSNTASWQGSQLRSLGLHKEIMQSSFPVSWKNFRWLLRILKTCLQIQRYSCAVYSYVRKADLTLRAFGIQKEN